MNPVYLVSGARTAIGDFGGSLKDHSPAELGRIVIAQAIRRAGLSADDVGHVVLGQVIPTVPKDAYLARVAAVAAGIPVKVPALTVNRLCGSGLQAIVSAGQMIALGECDVAVAGGAEVMSRAPHHVPVLRFGQRMGDATMVDAMIEVLSDPFEGYHMGVTAENVAQQCGIDRAAQDEAAAESHARAARAQEEGRFDSQIVAVEVRDRNASRLFDRDEHVRAGTTAESLGALRPAFSKDGTVTAGNASGINDGAGVEPRVMGLGPIEAVPIALERAGVTLEDMDVVESNEAFAAQACAVARALGFDPARTNPNGSGISLGHPVGATGAMLMVKLLYELERIDGRYGLATMCIGGGQGIAMVVERCR